MKDLHKEKFKALKKVISEDTGRFKKQTNKTFHVHGSNERRIENTREKIVFPTKGLRQLADETRP